MIVIADDLTGAAEITGICLRYGLKIHFTLNADTLDVPLDADVCIVSTDTRSMTAKDAVEFTHKLCSKLRLQGFTEFYKKTDSALRGHVIAELKAMQAELGCKSVLCIPVNPPNGRVIRNKTYFIGNEPIHETPFSKDPDFPAKSSYVKDLLHFNGEDIHTGVIKLTPAPTGFLVPDISGDEDLPPFLSLMSDRRMLPAGGGYFFNALLLHKGYRVSDSLPEQPVNRGKCLMVCGSTHRDSKIFLQKMKNNGIEVIEMTQGFSRFTHTKTDDEKFWIQKALRALDKDRKLILTISIDEHLSKDSPEYLKARLAQRVKTLLDYTKIEHLYVEGGATALAVVEKLGISEMVPEIEWQQGVVQMKTMLTSPACFTLKPGSYQWPDALINAGITKVHM